VCHSSISKIVLPQCIELFEKRNNAKSIVAFISAVALALTLFGFQNFPQFAFYKLRMERMFFKGK